MNVPLADLHKQYLHIKPEIDSAIQNVIANSQFILGKAVADFEAATGKVVFARNSQPPLKNEIMATKTIRPQRFFISPPGSHHGIDDPSQRIPYSVRGRNVSGRARQSSVHAARRTCSGDAPASK